MRVIYIASTSHSGSTLLSLMLNANVEIISAGELQNLNRQLQIKPRRKIYPRCSCGAPSLWQCNFWRAVDGYVRSKLGKSLLDFDMLDYSNLNERCADNPALFKAIASVSGKDLIVDSSKHPGRLSYLMRFGGLNIYPVHLIRSPEGQINSVLRKRPGLVKSILNYEIVNAQIRSLLRSVSHSVVRYEDLIVKPEATLRTVLEPLGVRYDPKQLKWTEFVAHDVAGNHMRWNKVSDLALDESWKRDLRHLQKYAIWCATILSRINNPETGFIVHN